MKTIHSFSKIFGSGKKPDPKVQKAFTVEGNLDDGYYEVIYSK
jgi:hypothetical protein